MELVEVVGALSRRVAELLGAVVLDFEVLDLSPWFDLFLEAFALGRTEPERAGS